MSDSAAEENLSPGRKKLFLSLAAVFAVLFLYGVWVSLQWWLASNHWVDLVNDVDHRMQPERFKDINSDRIRSPLEAQSIDDMDFNIVFLGDSYIHGFILQYKLAPPKQLQDILRQHYRTENINVWNFGWTTSSPVLQLRLLKDIGKKYQPDLVLLSLDMTDYKDDYFYRHLIAGDGAYGWIRKYPRTMYFVKQLTGKLDPLTGWHKQLFGYSAAKAYFVASEPLEENRHLFDETYDSLLQLFHYCRDELGVPFVVFIPPRHWQYTDKESLNSWDKGSYDVMGPYALENYRYFAELADTAPFPLVPLLDEFRESGVYPTTFDTDSHWNKHGARLMVKNVFSYLKNNNYLQALTTEAAASPRAEPSDNQPD